MGYMDRWTAIADDVLSVVLKEPDAWIGAIDNGVTIEDFPPGPWREVYHAAVEWIAEHDGKIPLDIAIARKCSSDVTVEWIAERQGMYDVPRSEAFNESCGWLVNDYGPGTRAIQVISQGEQRLQRLLNEGGTITGAMDQVIDGLAIELHRGHDLPVAGNDIMAEIDQDMARPADPGLKTGLDPVDAWLRGIGKGQLVGFPSPYKMRKTTIMSNITLNVGLAGGQINVFSFDEDRKRYARRLLAMLMTRYLWVYNLWDAKTDDGRPLNCIDGKMIRNAGQDWVKWPVELQNAWEYARDMFLTIGKNVRIYDVRSNKGDTFANIRANCRADSARFGELDMVQVDHIQRLGDWKTTYERVEMGSADSHTMSGELNTVVWMLSQVNEASMQGGAKNWSPQVKGGGGLSSNADIIMSSNYKQGKVEGQSHLVQLTLHLARDADFPQTGLVEIAPSSGWITPRQWGFYQIDSETWQIKNYGQQSLILR